MEQPGNPEVLSAEEIAKIWSKPYLPEYCGACKRAFLVLEEHSGAQCPMCKRARLESMPAAWTRQNAPEMMVKFAQTPARLAASLGKFTSGMWFAPDDLKPDILTQRLTPLFIPMWLVDATVSGFWQAEAGYDYQVKSTQEFYQSGRWQTREQMETRVRWEPRCGQINRTYQNIAAPALRDHEKILQIAGDYRFENSCAFDPAALGEAFIYLADLEPDAVWERVKGGLDHAAFKDCENACASQHFRNPTIQAEYPNQNWTHLLLPLFTTHYLADDGKAIPLLVNGLTGKVGGELRPSAAKARETAGIILTLAGLLLLAGIACLLLALLLPPLSAVGFILIAGAVLTGIGAILPSAYVNSKTRINP